MVYNGSPIVKPPEFLVLCVNPQGSRPGSQENDLVQGSGVTWSFDG